MTAKDRGSYARKHPSGRKPGEEISRVVAERAKVSQIPCAVAFTVVEDLNVPPAEVGLAADVLEIAIVKCQLGLFGYQPEKRIVKPAASVLPALEAKIRQGLLNGRLPCATAWQIAEEFHVPKMEVSSACETLKIKVSPCQLGAF
ncbi:MAG: hypothetical protein AB1512_32630 [Thermodesulfobacteriota bacterium]